MKLKYLTITIFLLLLAGTLSACGTGGATAASSWPGLAAQNGVAYLANNQFVYAIDIASGAEKWHYPAEAERNTSFYAQPFVSEDGQVFVGGFDNIFYSLSAQTGVQNWTFTGASDRYVGGAVLVGETVYASNAEGSLYALDAATGNQVWKFPEEGVVGAIWSKPAYNPECECLYITSMDHHVYAVNASDGSLHWSTEDLGGSVVGTPAIGADGSLYIGTFGREVLAISPANGQVSWRIPVTGWVWGGPTLVEDRMYFGDLDGYFYAVSIENREILFQIQPDAAIADSPLAVEDLIYFSAESGTLYAVDPDGSIQRTQPLNGKLYTSPVYESETLLVAALGGDELLYALNSSGVGKWNFVPEK